MSIVTDISIPQQIRHSMTQVADQAELLVIEKPEDYEFAGSLLRSIKTVRNNIDATFDGPIKAAHEAHKSILSAKKQHEAPLANAESVVKNKMGKWSMEQERIRRAEEARLRDFAQKEAEARRLAEAIELEKQGHAEKADALLAASVVAPTVVVPSREVKTDGVTQVRVWKFRIVDEAIVPIEFRTIDETKIRKVVNAMGDAAKIPGVDVYAEMQTRVKGF